MPGNDQVSNNSSGFNAVPHGIRNGGNFLESGEIATWWTSTPYNTNANVRTITYDNNYVIGNVHSRTIGDAISCIKD